MHESNGDLLVGGLRLKHVLVELAEQLPDPRGGDWILSGHLRLQPDQTVHLQLDRPYRLQLEDGRAGQVVLSRFVSRDETEEWADFHMPGSLGPVRQD